MPPAEAPASFAPLRPAPRARIRVAFVVGSLSWLVALVVLAFVVGRRDAVELALLVVAGVVRHRRARVGLDAVLLASAAEREP